MRDSGWQYCVLERNDGDGTTLVSREANRLQISFDVTVPGPGTYHNMGTLTTLSGETSTATNVVTIPNPDGDDEGTCDGRVLDPTIIKQVEPPFAQPGDTVSWTILVINPHNQAIKNITVSDMLPDVLTLLSTTTTNGTISISGQHVTLSIPTLNPLETVTLTIETQISKASHEFEILNQAILSLPERGPIQRARATVLKVEELPTTGEIPHQWMIVRGFIPLLSIGGIASLMVFKFYARLCIG